MGESRDFLTMQQESVGLALVKQLKLNAGELFMFRAVPAAGDFGEPRIFQLRMRLLNHTDLRNTLKWLQ